MTTYPFDPQQHGLLRWLGPLHAAVMQVLWDAGTSLPTSDVVGRVRAFYKVTYNPVVTTLERLSQRGMVVKHTVRWRAVETQAAFEGRQRQLILESLGVEEIVRAKVMTEQEMLEKEYENG